MNRYTVVWSQEARDQLAQLWLDADDRTSVTQAADQIDRLLTSETPLQHASEEHEGLYVLVVQPLRVQFTIDEADCLVRVWTIRQTLD